MNTISIAGARRRSRTLRIKESISVLIISALCILMTSATLALAEGPDFGPIGDRSDPSFTAPACTDTDGDGYATDDGTCGPVDCDDTDPSVHPGAAEICDGKDSNCDGWAPATDVDNDGDGVPRCANDCNDNDPSIYPGAPELCDGIDNDCNYFIPPVEKDKDGDGVRLCDATPDCNDNDAAINPQQAEICGDGKDNNCNSLIDEAGCITTCADADGDGYGTNSDPTCPKGPANDCNDTNAAVNPGASEGPAGNPTCSDTLDNDCDGLTDGAEAACQNNCVDSDGDGYGANGDPSCPKGTAKDCDDTDSGVHPGAAEICDGKDTNCDGWQAKTDVDIDGDGVPMCKNDCNDNDPTIYPGAPELCDGIDNDCNYFIPPVEKDKDRDGVRLCDAIPDCNDKDAAISPQHAEICGDGKDNNCNSLIDEAGCITTCADADGDGYGTNSDPTCPKGPANDCNDTNAAVNPGASEGPAGNPTCSDTLDNDCDGLTDGAEAACQNNCVDSDGDGYGANGDPSCPKGTAKDCNDSNASVHPGAAEICDGMDNNCDGWKPPTDKDKDGDGFALCAGDCNDNDPGIYPGAVEICADGKDNNCNQRTDEAGCTAP